MALIVFKSLGVQSQVRFTQVPEVIQNDSVLWSLPDGRYRIYFESENETIKSPATGKEVYWNLFVKTNEVFDLDTMPAITTVLSKRTSGDKVVWEAFFKDNSESVKMFSIEMDSITTHIVSMNDFLTTTLLSSSIDENSSVFEYGFNVGTLNGFKSVFGPSYMMHEHAMRANYTLTLNKEGSILTDAYGNVVELIYNRLNGISKRRVLKKNPRARIQIVEKDDKGRVHRIQIFDPYWDFITDVEYIRENGVLVRTNFYKRTNDKELITKITRRFERVY